MALAYAHSPYPPPHKPHAYVHPQHPSHRRRQRSSPILVNFPPPFRRLTLRLIITPILSLLFLSLLSRLATTILPYDNTISLFLHFWSAKALAQISFSRNTHDDWLRAPPEFKADLRRDVAVIFKTGYGTIDRVGAQLEAYGDWVGQENSIVVGDFAGEIEVERGRGGGGSRQKSGSGGGGGGSDSGYGGNGRDEMDWRSGGGRNANGGWERKKTGKETVPVHDAIRMMIVEGQAGRFEERIAKYERLQTAITLAANEASEEEEKDDDDGNGDGDGGRRSERDRAMEVGRGVGWELDAMKVSNSYPRTEGAWLVELWINTWLRDPWDKPRDLFIRLPVLLIVPREARQFIPGLERLYRQFPNKKWYIMVDDDTLLIRPTLQLLLDHLDPDIPQYIGNAVGDFQKRFAHGGSSYLISRAAMEKLFVDGREVVQRAYRESITETWGDRLIASALIRVGVHVNERYGHYFNGESPLATRIQGDRFCSPLVSFHKLNTAQKMREAGELFRDREAILTWKNVWEIYDGRSWENFAGLAGREDWDHVGGQAAGYGEIYRANSAIECMHKCERDGKNCLAWTWKEVDRTCHLMTWFVVGKETKGVWSGLNTENIERLARICEGDGHWGTGSHY
ncbi:family 31 glycosyltransferase [Zalerion maritima]|uniref:N-acetylgalactosaminide beta-1,3-galactosyltransferase n=1 Tax=Zalerion maritima TaxID=339359 RepID=A0AAD5WM07_9PEZI|nr:family 31 glycosyltransferase [Zalerion maritima]